MIGAGRSGSARALALNPSTNVPQNPNQARFTKDDLRIATANG
jgi:hypothetical protein